MKKLYKLLLLPIAFLVVGHVAALAQSTVSGTIKDKVTGEGLAGVNIVVKGLVANTITDTDGKFSLKVTGAPPFTLSVSFVGYKTQDVEIKDANATLDIGMEEQTLLGQEVVVSASRVEESILKSPVTIEKMDLLAIKSSSAPDFYDALANMKGVTVTNSSLNFTAVNTRGFATISNVRFVQWVDGMDTQAPILNFPTGTIMGLNELDAESIELIPGAASALYGPNAFNGIMIMKSKSPFDYQGLSMQVKQGVVSSKAAGTNPLGMYTLRYAKAINNKFAFKVNFSYMQATDWRASDYKTDRNIPGSTTDLSKTPGFDGMNLYGDETAIPTGVPSIGTIRRTGLKEQDILDNPLAKTIKGDIALHYRITDKIEASYVYRYGGGNTVYQGSDSYALREFNQQFHKVEFKGDNFFVRGYLSETDAGRSYNLAALGGFANETISPTATQWAPDYVLAMQGYYADPNYTGSKVAGDPAAARAYADRFAPKPGSPEFTNLMTQVRANYFQHTPTGSWANPLMTSQEQAFLNKNPKNNLMDLGGGASFKDNSKIWHSEFNYNFKQIKWADIMVGGNFRQYSLYTFGTVLNEAPTDQNPNPDYKRIFINQYGVYTQISKTIAEKLKLTGSIRYDKSDNFDAHFTPRFSAVYNLAENHNIRGSYQTGFRIPDTQAQFIFFPTSGGILLGSTKANSERYGIMNGGAYTQSSYNNFINNTTNPGSLDPTTGAVKTGDATLLQTANIAYVKPEQLQSFEIGYKGIFAGNLMADVNYYYTSYTGFIGQQVIVSKKSTQQFGGYHGTSVTGNPSQIDAGTLWAPSVNASQGVTSQGIGVGLTYNLPRNFSIMGNYNWAQYKANETGDFRAGFNTPTNRYSIGLSNRKLTKNLGFNVNFRYQDAFQWVSSYAIGNIPHYGVVDAQVTYKMAPIKTVLKIGGTNIGGGDYRTAVGSPFVGQQYYISLTFDEFLK